MFCRTRHIAMKDSNIICTSSTGVSNDTVTRSSRLTLPARLAAQPLHQIEDSVGACPDTAAFHVHTPTQAPYSSSDTQSSSSGASYSISDGDFNDSSAESGTAPTHPESGRISVAGNRRSTLAPSSVVQAPSSTVSRTLVNDDASDNGSGPQSSLRHARHARQLTATEDHSEIWSEDDTFINQPETNLGKSLSKKNQGEDSFDGEQTMSNDNTLFEYHLKRSERQHPLQQYLTEDPGEGPWNVYNHRVSTLGSVVLIFD